jgi:FixJ family two-component response regulator
MTAGRQYVYGSVVGTFCGDAASGIGLRRRLEASRSSLPVIFMTGLDDAATRGQALKAGCVANLQKPFYARQLMEAIHKTTT